MNASIIIPAFNRIDMTIACLTALYEHTDDYELILIDNGSGDATHDLEGPDIVIRNAENLGFARACNQGAALASGDVLIFLNNDTEPCPGWLKPLLDALKAPNVAVAGSMLTYPDGRVQHAGVGLRGSGRTYEAFNMTDPRPFGDVAAVTGACLAIRREIFNDLGRFDEGYWNGYEDVDLCLRVREAGYRIVYDPDSIVIHHESASGPERWSHVRENVERLQKRWGG